MKKLIAVLVVALIATSLFASFSVGVSAGFEQFNGKLFEATGDEDYTLGRKNALAVAANASYNFTDDFSLFDSFTVMFGKDFSLKGGFSEEGETEWKLFKDMDSSMDDYSLFTLKNRVGFAYKLPVESSVDFSVGASFVYGNGIIRYEDYDSSEEETTEVVMELFNYGVGLNLKAAYEIQDGLSAFVALDGDFAFKQGYASGPAGYGTKMMMVVDAFSFSFGAKAGVMYTF